MNGRSPLRLGTAALVAIVLVAIAIVLAACGPAPTAVDATQPPPTSATEPAATDAPDAAPTTMAAEPTDAVTREPSPTTAELPDDPLLAVELVDVRSGETFTLGELATEHGPVLLEPMAVWCSSCLAQQREVVAAHELGSFSSVSLDVELSELPEDLAAFADDHGFDWHFAMADAELFRSLQERFGPQATFPPSTPLIVIEPDGTVRALEFGRGIRSAEDLVAEIEAS